MFNYSEDKNKLAMMAMPVLLTIFFGFIGSGTDTAIASDSERSQEMRLIETSGRTDDKDSAESKTSSAKKSKKQQLKSAIEANDYHDFLVAAKDTPFADVMTKEAFEFLVDEYNLRNQGYQPSPYTDLT